MTGKPLSPQQIAALWRAYKIRQTARFVGDHCHVSKNTAAKYIRNHNFAARYAKLQAKADEFLDEDQAKSLANTLKSVANARALLLQDLLVQIKKGDIKASVSDVDKIVHLERYLRGEPDSRTEQDFSFEWLDDDDDDGDGDGNGNGEGDGDGNGNGNGNGNVDGNGNREGADKSA